MRKLLYLAIALSVSGCVTFNGSVDALADVPDSRILSVDLSTKKPDHGRIIIKRDSGIWGAACSTRVFVDAVPVVDIRQAEKHVMYLPDGEHVISASPNGVCGGGMAEVSVSVRPSTTLMLRIGSDSYQLGRTFIRPTAF